MTPTTSDVTAAIDDFLEHHGVDGQRWGKRRGPPYPLDKEDKAANRAAAKKAKEKAKTVKRIQKNKKKNAAEAKKQAKKDAKTQAEQAKKDAELAKKKAKYAKTPKGLYTHRELFTVDEISDALKGFEWEGKMLDAMDKDFVRAKNNVKNFADYASTIVKFADTAIDGYNTIATLNKHFGGDMQPIQKLGKGGGDNAKKKDKDKDDD